MILAKMIPACLFTTLVLLHSAAQSVRPAGRLPNLVAARYAAGAADPFSRLAHPATLPGGSAWQVGGYVEKRFGVSGLNAGRLAALVATPGGGAGAGLWYFGNFRYQETSVTLAYGRVLGKLQLGWLGRLHLFRVAGYGKTLVTDFGLASRWALSDRLAAGFFFLNPVGVRLNGRDRGAGLQRMGLGWLVSEQVYAGIDLIKEENRPLQVFTLLQYRVREGLTGKAGIYSEEGQFFFGIEWQRQRIRTAFCFGYHPLLGLSPAAYAVYGQDVK